MKKIVLLVLVSVLLSTAVFVRFVRPVEAFQAVYIKANGSVYPLTAPIQRDGDTYTFTDNIYAEYGFYVQRSNITIDGSGYTLQGSGKFGYCGIILDEINNVTIKNTNIENFSFGFHVWGYEPSYFMHSIDESNLVDGKPVYYLVNQRDLVINPVTYPEIGYLALVNCINMRVEDQNLPNVEPFPIVNTNNSKIASNNILNSTVYILSSSNIIISGNNITNHGIRVLYSNNTTVSGNIVNGGGINLGVSSNTIVSRNNITNCGRGIWLNEEPESTIISENNFINNTRGIYVATVAGQTIVYHNNFINDTYQVVDGLVTGDIIWDDGYSSGGNYWSDYTGVDMKSGPNQDQSGSDGIGDTPYVIYGDTTDRYPLMSPWTPPEHELVMSITAPAYLGVNSSSLLNAIVTNEGLNDEANVELELLINGTIVDSTTIPLLRAGNSYTLSHLWTPTIEGTYNVTAYVNPVSEESIQNNQRTTLVTVAVSPPSEVQIGVKAGDWMKYDYAVTGWPSGTPYPEWLKVEILSVEGTTATVRVTMHMSDGTEQSDTLSVDVVAGGGTFDTLFGFVIPANCTTGDSIVMGGDGLTFNVTIDGETTRTYAGAKRTVVYASFSQYGSELTYYWDKETGVMVEASTTSGGITGTAKATETNMWEAGPSPFWMQWWLWAIVAVVIVALAGTVYFMKKRKPPTPTAPTPPAEGTLQVVHRAYSFRGRLQTKIILLLLG